MDNCIKILIADADEGFTSDLADCPKDVRLYVHNDPGG